MNPHASYSEPVEKSASLITNRFLRIMSNRRRVDRRLVRVAGLRVGLYPAGMKRRFTQLLTGLAN